MNGAEPHRRLAAATRHLSTQQQAAVRRAVLRLWSQLASTRRLEDIATAVLGACGRLLPLRAGVLRVYRDGHCVHRTDAVWRERRLEVRHPAPGCGEPTAAQRRRPWIEDGRAQLPLTTAGRACGLLTLVPRRPLPAAHLPLLAALTEPAAAALGHALDDLERDQRSALADAIGDSAIEGLWLLDENAVIVMVNRRVGEILGYRCEELIGRSVFEFVDAADAEALRRHWRGQKVLRRELTLRHRDGSRRWLDVAARALPPVPGQRARLLVAAVDVTERRRAEAARTASEERYRRLVETCPDIIWCTDRELRITYVNSAVESVTGHRPDEVIGRRKSELQTPEQFELDRALVAQVLAGHALSYESTYLRKDGRLAVMRITASPLFQDGRVVGMIGNAMDISGFRSQQEVLRQRERQLRRTLDQLPAVVWTTDQSLRIQTVGGARLCVMQGADERLILGRTPEDLFGFGDVLAHMSHRALVGDSVSREGRRVDRIWQTMIEPLRDPAGAIVGTLGIALDVTELRSSQHALADERERAQATLESIGDGVITTDPEGRVTYMNPVAETLCGWMRGDAYGRPIDQVFRPLAAEDGRPLPDPVREVLHRRELVPLPPSSQLRRRDGEVIAIDCRAAPVRDHNGQLAGTVLVFQDVSAARMMAERLSYQATHDALTDLPNRALLTDRLSQSLIQAARYGSRVAVMFIDLDRFKHINDTLGHAVGDALLKQVAERLRGCVRRSDTVSRQGGDEFVILLPEAGEPMELSDLAEKIVSRLGQPYRVQEHELHLSASIGVSLFPDDGADAETLLRHADIAMYHAKEAGRNTFQFFIDDMNRRATERLFLEHSLRRALERNELVLRYQPQINLASGRIVGVEALLRWRHPKRGLISPADFVPVAEDSGLILTIGRWVLEQACRQAREWQAQGLPPLRIAVNVSIVELRQSLIVRNVERILADSGLEPGQLELELTESVVMNAVPNAIRRLGELKELGLRLSIDDFGTGYSSLSYLKGLPVDSLKIDQAFIRDLSVNDDDAAIADAIIRMGHSLRLTIIAEGVESRAALNFLRDRQCDDVQGYYFSRPLDPEAFVEMYHRHETARVERRGPPLPP